MPLRIRKFLNRQGSDCDGGAFILIEVNKVGKSGWVDIVCKIADCSRTVSLDFDLYKGQKNSNAIKKARLLAESFTRLADEMERVNVELNNWSKHEK